MTAREPGGPGKALTPVFVLVHSPSAGPLSWQPVADRLRALGHETVVPDLLSVADAKPPFWTAVVDAVNALLAELDLDQSVVLVAHSNAGVFVPLLAAQAVRPVRACLFVATSSVPAAAGATPVYLVFGPPYDAEAAEARNRGWLVRQLPGQHLHQLVDPAGTAGHWRLWLRLSPAMPPRSTRCLQTPRRLGSRKCTVRDLRLVGGRRCRGGPRGFGPREPRTRGGVRGRTGCRRRRPWGGRRGRCGCPVPR